MLANPSRCLAQFLVCLGTLCCVAGPVLAHRVPECLTTITPVADGSRLEIVHRLHRHDAQRALAQLQGNPKLRLSSLEGRAAFALYVEEHFVLATQPEPEAALPLELIGAQLRGDYLLVFQEYRGALPQSLAVRSDVLRALDPQQVNLVHVKWRSGTRRLTFAEDSGWQQVSR